MQCKKHMLCASCDVHLPCSRDIRKLSPALHTDNKTSAHCTVKMQCKNRCVFASVLCLYWTSRHVMPGVSEDTPPKTPAYFELKMHCVQCVFAHGVCTHPRMGAQPIHHSFALHIAVALCDTVCVKPHTSHNVCTYYVMYFLHIQNAGYAKLD